MDTLAFWRRVLFTAVLLFTGAITVACSQACYQWRPSLTPLGDVFWGFNSLDLILAFWFAGRIRSWRSRSTWMRLTVYLLAFGYGSMLFDATQDWWTKTAYTFHLPGAEYGAYGRPFIMVLPLLCAIPVLLPVLRFTRLTLHEIGRPCSASPVSVFDLMVWMTLAAVVLVWIRFLNSSLAPQTAYKGLTLAQNFEMQTMLLLLSLIPSAVLIIQCLAWRRHWTLAIAVLFAGWVFDSVTTGFATHAIGYFGGPSFGVLSGDSIDRWCYIGGRSLMGFSFGGLALLLGITLQRCPQIMTNEESNPKEAAATPSQHKRLGDE